MDEPLEAVTADAIAVLRQAGARFAYPHGSRAVGQHRADSDIDIAAYFGGRPPNSFDVLLPPGVDLLILDDAPLELAGRGGAGRGGSLSAEGCCLQTTGCRGSAGRR